MSECHRKVDLLVRPGKRDEARSIIIGLPGEHEAFPSYRDGSTYGLDDPNLLHVVEVFPRGVSKDWSSLEDLPEQHPDVFERADDMGGGCYLDGYDPYR